MLKKAVVLQYVLLLCYSVYSSFANKTAPEAAALILCKFSIFRLTLALADDNPVTKFFRPGSNVSFPCPSIDHLTNSSVTLIGPSFNKTVNPTETVKFRNVELSSSFIRVHNVSLRDRGSYSCIASNGTETRFRLHVLGLFQIGNLIHP